MRFDEGPPRAAPACFPYPDHGTLADVWGVRSEPEPPKPRGVKMEARLERMSAERAFERFSRGEW